MTKQFIIAFTAVKYILTFPAIEGIIAGIAFEVIITGIAREGIIPAPPVQVILADAIAQTRESVTVIAAEGDLIVGRGAVTVNFEYDAAVIGIEGSVSEITGKIGSFSKVIAVEIVAIVGIGAVIP